MATCPTCGAPLREGAKFCSSCGSSTNLSVPADPRTSSYPGRSDSAFRNSRDYRSNEYSAFNNNRRTPPSGGSFGSRSDPYRQGSGRRAYDPGDPFGSAARDNSRGYGRGGYDSRDPYGDGYGGYGRPGSRKGMIILFCCIGGAVLLAGIILLIVLLGKGGPGSNPQATVKSFIKATSKLDVDAMNKCLVPEERAPESARSEIAAAKKMIKEFNVTITNMQDPIYNSDKTQCDITATLNMSVTVDDSFAALYGTSGLPQGSSNSTFHLRKVDGKWLISDMSDFNLF